MTMSRTIEAVSKAFADHVAPARPYVAVVVDDDDAIIAVGAFKTRPRAQAQATRGSGDRPEGWRRGFVACRSTDGGVVVMSGSLVIGTHA